MGKKLIIKNANFYNSALEHEGDTVCISVVAKPIAGGVCTGGGDYTIGRTAEISATPNTNYKFEKWDDGDTNSTRTVVAITDKTYTACFAEKVFEHTYANTYSTISVDTMPAGDYIIVINNTGSGFDTQVILKMGDTEVYRSSNVNRGETLETTVNVSSSFNGIRSAISHVVIYKITEP